MQSASEMMIFGSLCAKMKSNRQAGRDLRLEETTEQLEARRHCSEQHKSQRNNLDDGEAHREGGGFLPHSEVQRQ